MTNSVCVQRPDGGHGRIERVEATDGCGSELLKRAKVEGMRILSRRQKIIKFADRSETGWAVVGRVRGRYLGIKLGRRETNGEGGERFARYHHVDVAQHHRKYLGFEWGEVVTHL